MPDLLPYIVSIYFKHQITSWPRSNEAGKDKEHKGILKTPVSPAWSLMTMATYSQVSKFLNPPKLQSGTKNILPVIAKVAIYTTYSWLSGHSVASSASISVSLSPLPISALDPSPQSSPSNFLPMTKSSLFFCFFGRNVHSTISLANIY